MAEATTHTNGKLESAKSTAQNAVRDIGNRANEKAEQLVDRLPEAVRTAQNKVADVVENVATVATDRAGQAAEWISTKGHAALDRTDEALSSTRKFVRQYPMRTLAAGVAVGAVIGWLFTQRKNA